MIHIVSCSGSVHCGCVSCSS